MALGAHGVARQQVERDDLGRLAGHRGLGVFADQHAGRVVVGGEERVGGVRRIGRAVECDHLHALVACLLDGRHDGLGVAGRDEDGLGAGGDHVFHRRDLARVVAVGLSCPRQQLGAEFLGFFLRALFHLHEEGVGLGLGDQADDGRVGGQGRGRGRCGKGQDGQGGNEARADEHEVVSFRGAGAQRLPCLLWNRMTTRQRAGRHSDEGDYRAVDRLNQAT
ncbi:hypothetical protein D9M68_638180 [compost metagenome]